MLKFARIDLNLLAWGRDTSEHENISTLEETEITGVPGEFWNPL